MSKVIVSPFNKDEVKEIVNEGLKEGSIKVDGGTKLYKHEFKMTDANHAEFLVTIIATTSAAITSYAGGPPKLDIDTDKIVNAFSNSALAAISYAKISGGTEKNKTSFPGRRKRTVDPGGSRQ